MTAGVAGPRSFEVDGDAHAHVLAGELDGSTALSLLSAATAFLTESQGEVTLDLGCVTSADSAGCEAIVAMRADMQASRAHLWLANRSAVIKPVPPPAVQERCGPREWWPE
jgi:ABC-type transporter Mla MlaB component